jgi:hypothetical protein
MMGWIVRSLAVAALCGRGSVRMHFRLVAHNLLWACSAPPDPIHFFHHSSSTFINLLTSSANASFASSVIPTNVFVHATFKSTCSGDAMPTIAVDSGNESV